MDERVKYLLFCMETYKQQRNLTGAEMYEVFKRYNFIGYIMDLFELFHIQGTRRLMEELDEYQYAQDRMNIQ
jgi:hypothetical protein